MSSVGINNRWLLPESIADVLPSEARRLEELRRALLDHFHIHGYELVMPPLLEYVESLLTGAGHDLDLCTFKLVDQLSGRTMGLRTDITPQVARIDAHLLNREGVTRLCYAGSVLRTRPTGFHATREPLQVGAEIYGYAGIEADLEIAELLVSTLRLVQPGVVYLDLCHAGLLEALLGEVLLAADVKALLYDALAAKDMSALQALLGSFSVPLKIALLSLPTLYGSVSEVLSAARRVLPDQVRVREALAQMEQMALMTDQLGVRLTLDLADIRGHYHYHTGMMFSAYVDGVPNAIARGGRYDKIGQAFGRARPATGFSLDLREIGALTAPSLSEPIIYAPWGQDRSLIEKIAHLRATGEVVVQLLPGQQQDNTSARHRTLELKKGVWVITS
ncbi:MAG: ATP phosphoribosyltransferase regulatory subunit [Ottowia sp.]|nr:ATP phosphoribosyltransferase regulatory subunit [Ottowia sp.]